MPRRAGQPEHIRSEIRERAQAGYGLDNDSPVTWNGTVIPAVDARSIGEPSSEMLAVVKDVTGYLEGVGAKHIDVVFDFHKKGNPGHATVRWIGEVPAKTVATEFAVNNLPDGTPRIPAWLSLRADHDFDLRWQDPF